MTPDDFTPEMWANEIRISWNTGDRTTYLLVEGRSDFDFFNKFVNRGQCRIRFLKGNKNVKALIRILEKENITFVSIIDADFARLTGNAPTNPNVIITDGHDLEMMLFCSFALNKVLSKYKAEELLRQKKPMNIINLIKDLEFLRWINDEETLGLDFTENLSDFELFVDVANFKFDLSAVFTALCKNNLPLVKFLKSELSKRRQSDSIDLLQLCNGHDVMEVTCLCIKHRNESLTDLTRKRLEQDFRSEYGAAFLKETQMYQEILRICPKITWSIQNMIISSRKNVNRDKCNAKQNQAKNSLLYLQVLPITSL